MEQKEEEKYHYTFYEYPSGESLCPYIMCYTV